MGANALNIVFGLTTVASLVFAVYTYFKSRELVYPLIEKLRSSRNHFIKFYMAAERIEKIAESQGTPDAEKVGLMREAAGTITLGHHTVMNVIDEGQDWGAKSSREIRKLLHKRTV